MHEQLTATEVLQNQIQFAASLKRIKQITDEGAFHGFQDVPFGFRVSDVFLAPNKGRLFKDFHCKHTIFVSARDFPHLHHFAITTSTENPKNLKVPRPDFGVRWIHSFFYKFDSLDIWIGSGETKFNV